MVRHTRRGVVGRGCGLASGRLGVMWVGLRDETGIATPGGCSEGEATSGPRRCRIDLGQQVVTACGLVF